MAPTQSKIKTTKLNTVAVKYDDDGLVDVDSWHQVPMPTTATPYTPSLVSWMRGMGPKEANGVVDMYRALIKADPKFYNTRMQAALAVVRAFQVLHDAVPAHLLPHWGGQVPKLKGVHYYSLTQIVKSSPEVLRLVEAVEEEAGVPYVTQMEASFKADFAANNKLYTPSDATLETLTKPLFVSKAAAQAAVPPVAATTPRTTRTNTPAKRTRRSLDGGAGQSVTPGTGGKCTDFAKESVKKYMQACRAKGIQPDAALLASLHDLSDDETA